MEGIINYWTFVAAAFFFILTPGIDTVYILNKSIAQGKKAGIYSTLGIGSGVLVHTIIAAMGLSLILVQSATAFMMIKYLGTAYLLYLGIKKLMEKESMLNVGEAGFSRHSLKQNFLSGVITNTLNPKVALFFLAFFPQFIDPASLESPLPFIALGLSYCLLTIVWFLVLSSFAALFSARLKNNPKTSIWINKASGLVFILMSLKIALGRR